MEPINHPVIVIGMHRSGTSMIIKLLRDLGLHIGLDANNPLGESKFFFDRNDKLLQIYGGSWDHPHPIDILWNNKVIQTRVRDCLERDMTNARVLPYLGLKNYIRYRSPISFPGSWGWKDPRNTFTLPLWKLIFPQASVLHIYRNGIDVSQSLRIREINRLSKLRIDQNSRGKNSNTPSKSFQEKSLVNLLCQKTSSLRKRMDPLHKYEVFHAHPCSELDKGFSLWKTYVGRAFELTSKFPDQSLTIKYEDFLERPNDLMIQMAKFCHLNVTKSQIETACRSVDSSRRFAFQDNDELTEFYRKVKSDPLVEKLGYNSIGL